MKIVKYCVNLDVNSLKQLNVIAEKQGRTVTELVREAVAKIIIEYPVNT